MYFILISPEQDHPHEIEWVMKFLDEGLDYYHVRKPQINLGRLMDYLSRFPDPYRKRLVIHQHPDLSTSFELAGIHLRERVWQNDLASIQQSGFPIHSASFHNEKDLLEFPLDLEYGFLSPIFPSISKKGYSGDFKDEQLIKFNNDFQGNCLALGGIRAGKIEKVKQLGFEGVAVLGAVWQSANPVWAFEQIKEQIANHS